MSHLSLDARAILEYLNELGYRNISAEQLKEFMKGMQPQSENNNNKQKSTITTANSNNQQQRLPTTTNLQLQQLQAQQQQSNRKHHHQHHHTPKIIKGKKPLSNFKFYLDIRDHQLTKKIEDQIAILGGSLDFFLTESVTHFVTDKSVLPPPVCTNNNNTLSSRPGTPLTPGTPQTPISHDQQPHSPYESNLKHVGGISNNVSSKKQTRADAMLNRARRQSTTTVATPTSLIPEQQQQQQSANNSAALLQQKQPYIIWQTEYALRFFKRITHDLKDYLEAANSKKSSGSAKVEPISLKGGFIKIEAIKHNQRPYYQLFRKPTSEWPKIELNREDGAFRLSPKKKDEPVERVEDTSHRQNLEKQATKMTRKSRSRSSHRGQTVVKKSSNAGVIGLQQKCKQQVKQETSEKQCGVCEICKIEYDTLTIHLKTKDHEYFARNSQNFIALDTLIHTSADVNKFLDSNKELEDNEEKSELEEEMEMAESTGPLDANAPDPLEDISATVAPQLHKQRLSAYSPVKTPSPTLREKSKRSTKGKHSSEKFQNTIAAVKPVLKSASLSPQKKSNCSSLASSGLELHRIKEDAAVVDKTTPLRRKSVAIASTISPPIRAMLPPSSLYKVVETTTGENCTPPRKIKDSADATASPSLIVKFKKVRQIRQTELAVLNGEAENFMFPKVRTSSDLPTDMDRQTTSENTQMSSTSLDSSSCGNSQQMDIDCEPPPLPKPKSKKIKTKVTPKKAIAVAQRSKSRSNVKQSFPSAPIQPELTTLKRNNNAVVTARTTTNATSAMTAASITLPEATRKSSRTATAIVTAATTSSRLLRAAVEAAKNNQRISLNANGSNCNKIGNNRRKSMSLNTISVLPKKLPKMTRRNTTTMATIVNLEDRMGDNDESESNTAESDVIKKKFASNFIDDDVADESDDEDEDDDDDDEDYIGTIRNYSKQKNVPTLMSRRSCPVFTTRDQRAANRASLKLIDPEKTEEIKSESDEIKTKPTPKVKIKPSPLAPSATFTPAKKKTSPQRAFDLRKSESISKMTYAFERLPSTDLWYRVFDRQDNCEEEIFEYYGTTKYRKLPYELGPIPFDRTLDDISCKLCGKGCVAGAGVEAETIEMVGKYAPLAKIEKQNLNDSIPKVIEKESLEKVRAEPAVTATTTQTTAPSSPSPSFAASSSNYTHKKLHLLQRYRQEQQELLLKQQEKQQQLKSVIIKSESKSSTPDREPHERAGSTHSNASSYASSTGTFFSKKFPRNKHLNKAALVSLELPPRKSPREHASTLALVSCIIKQRQDSQSKPNSETDEAPYTPTPLSIGKEEETKPAPILLSNVPNEIPPPPQQIAILSPRTTRSAVVTPVEELRFATEISENVKRLRRGQNKYDHSPTVIVPKKSRIKCEPIDNSSCSARISNKVNANGDGIVKKKGRPRKYPIGTTPPIFLKRRRRQMGVHPYAMSTSSKFHHHSSSYHSGQSRLPSIRKTGSKKGVLEYEVDSAAIKALDTAKQYTNLRLLEWEIDKYLQIVGCEYDIDEQFAASLMKPKSISENLNDEAASATTINKKASSTTKRKSQVQITVTPPTTDYFSSDFDLYDLFTCPPQIDAYNGVEQDPTTNDGKRKEFSLYNSVALQNYFKKRKNLKCNRTGWPKAQRKKSSARQQQKLKEKISFLQAIGAQPVDGVNGSLVKQELLPDDDEFKDQTRQSGVITPPDSDIDDDDEDEKVSTANDDEDADETEQDAAESIPEEDETVIDSVDRNHEADVEEENDDDDVDGGAATAEDEDEVDDTARHYEPAKRRTRRSTLAASPAEKHLTTTTTGTMLPTTSYRLDINTTATPSTQMLRNLRRTPLFNGSLGSCVSPSEKAGDNSDIFTVSSDGLDTDLDLSNSHSQLKSCVAMGNTDDYEKHEHCVNHHTPKKKFDLAKYASNNAAAASSCAAEAATMVAKSLAISQFLKKEVKVQCRRLRAPFRRFRYRR